MKLELFDFIDEAMKHYSVHKNSYSYAEGALKDIFEKVLSDYGPNVVGIHTRVKSEESVREKLLRNKYYLDYKTPSEALEAMHDIVGITIECRFIRNEHEIYDYLRKTFCVAMSDGMMCADAHPEVYLNLRMVQPQIQRNGYAIYRIDGCYHFNGHCINFELQIKALVHRFWSEIEHEVIYKNQELVDNDGFLRSMLGSLSDSLDVVDRQMEIIYNQISNDASSMSIGLDEKTFKTLAARSINELVKRKMLESVGFSTDFRKDASILAQFIYIRCFLKGGNNEVRMVEFLEHLNYLSEKPLHYDEPIVLEAPYHGTRTLSIRLEAYWESKFNADFEWHAVFTTLFAIQNSPSIESLSDFADVISNLLLLPSMLCRFLAGCSKETLCAMQNKLEESMAQGIIEADTIETIHEDMLYQMMQCSNHAMEQMKEAQKKGELDERADEICSLLRHRIVHLFS